MKYLAISSTQRTDGKPQNARYQFSNGISIPKGTTKLRLKNFEIFNSIYTIDQYNNRLDFNYNGTIYNTTLTNGVYNITELITHINNQMAASLGSSDISLSYDSTKNKVSVNSTLNSSLLFSSSDSNNPAYLLGFLDSTNLKDPIDTPYGTTYEANACVNLNQVTNIFISIEINDKAYPVYSIGNNFKSTFIVPFDSTSGQLSTYGEFGDFPQEIQLEEDLNKIMNMSISLSYQNPRGVKNLDLQGTNYFICFEFV